MDAELFRATIQVVATAVITLLPLTIVIGFFILRRDRERRYFELELRHLNDRQFEREKIDSIAESTRDENFSARGLFEIQHRLERIENILQTRPAIRLPDTLNKKIDSMEKILGEIQVANPTSNESIQIVREITHSLNTPISQIEAASTLLSSSLSGDTFVKESAISIQKSLDICKVFLGAYREITAFSSTSAVWNPDSLNEMIKRSIDIYAGHADKVIVAEVDIAITIDGYSNNFVAAILLPLLENAVDASFNGGAVSVHSNQFQDDLVIKITNPWRAKDPGLDMYMDGYTTKGDEHTGTGLSSVKTLLSNISASDISHSCQAGKLEFTIRLPMRRI